MRRKVESTFQQWKNSASRKPLMVLGCRQVGKTYSIRRFLSKSYDSYLEINLERQPELKMCFTDNMDASAVVDKLLISTGSKLTPHKSAIFIDEIQSSPEALSSLKWFSEDDRYDVVVSGSFLGSRLSESESIPISPLGYVTVFTMYPMDFEEFLWAMDVDVRIMDSAKASIQDGREVEPIFNKVLSDLFLRFLIVGGMPEAVKTYSSTKDYTKVRKVLKDILEILGSDVNKYSSRKDKMKIGACLRSIPSQLASHKRSFEYIDIEKKKGSGERVYGDALDWLISAGMAHRCDNLRAITPPLSHNIVDGMFKIYICDTGLLLALMDDADPGAIVNKDPFSNNGIIMENAVANTLVSKGYPLYYYAKRDSTLEIDFVMNIGSTIRLVEVKSGRNKRSKSLNTLLDEGDRNRIGYKVCLGNVSVDERGAIHLPIYGASFLPDSVPDEIPPVDIVAVNRLFDDGSS